MVPLLPFLDANGHIFPVEGYPDFIEDWKAGEDLSNDRHSLLKCVEAAMQLAATSIRVIWEHRNLTLQVFFSNGSSVIVRASLPTDPPQEAWRLRKFNSEVHIMRWVQQITALPLPHIHHIAYKSTNCPYDFVIMQKLPGITIANSFALFSKSVKKQVIISFANVALELFRLPVPQRIGTTTPGPSEGTLDVMPRIGLYENQSAPRVFDTLEEYVSYLIDLKRSSLGSDEAENLRARSTLSELESRIGVLLEQVNRPAFRRCVLVHEDMNETNILADSGQITGVLDWEIHCIQPVILAAAYPVWLSYDGPEDPLFAYPGTLWCTTREESQELSTVFEDVVKSRDPEFFDALIEGKKIRAVVSWLRGFRNASDPGCDRLREWMVSVLQ